MLYPEVSDFKPSRHYSSTELRDSKRQKPPSELQTSYFNHSVCFVLPDTAYVPDSLRAELTGDTDYYRIDSVPATEFLDKEFIEAFVKHGELTALSIGKKIDVDNCIGLCPTGELLLSLVTEDYHQLGLEGSPSFFARGSPDRYLVRIDLKADDFAPGRKRYDYILSALENRLDHRTFDVILAWNPPEERTCPSSAAAWFHDRGHKVSLCRAKYHGRSEYSVAVPLLADGCDRNKIFEWIGAFSVAADLSASKEEAEEYVNSYKCPEPSAYVGQVQYLQWDGLFTRNQIRKVYRAVERYPTPELEGLWNSFHVQGFADAVVSFSSKEHNYCTAADGDSSLTILFQRNGKYVTQKSLSSNNKPRGRP